MLSTVNYFQSIRAEWIKSKSFSVISLAMFCLAFVITIVLAANYMDVYNRVGISTNPWDRLFNGGMAIYVLFVMAPFLILLIAAITYIEENANGWKFMYTLNVSRSQIYLSKLLVILILLVVVSIILGFLLLGSGYVLDLFLPEYEFAYYAPNFSYLLKTIARSLVVCLGALGLQYMISIMTNNVILSLGIGFFTFIIAFIFTFSDTALVFYNPFAWIMINQDFGAIDSNYKKDLIDGVLTNVEVYSILSFVVFTMIGCFYEDRKNII